MVDEFSIGYLGIELVVNIGSIFTFMKSKE